MAIPHRKDASILKTGTCQGTQILIILGEYTLNHAAQFAKYETTQLYVTIQQGLSRTQCLHHTCLFHF